MKKLIEQLYKQATAFGCCEKFTGEEDLELLTKLFRSPQGIEFCQKHNFPDLQILRQFKPYALERFGIYIDAGRIALTDPRQVVLTGDTQATIICTTTQRHQVVLMHGAKAEITASNWAGVDVVNRNECPVRVVTTDRARVL